MSQPARRLTAAVLVAATLAVAAPAGAAPPPRSPARGTGEVLGSLWQQVASWLEALWLVHSPQTGLPRNKDAGTPLDPPSDDADANPLHQHRGILIDPNG